AAFRRRTAGGTRAGKHTTSPGRPDKTSASSWIAASGRIAASGFSLDAGFGPVEKAARFGRGHGIGQALRLGAHHSPAERRHAVITAALIVERGIGPHVGLFHGPGGEHAFKAEIGRAHV